MDYEKKYNEALERARALWREAIEKEYVNDYLKDYETIFPELRESEDERMMREFNDWLCEEIECRTNDLRDEKDRRTLNMLCYVLTKVKDWLEKQKEHQFCSDAPKEKSVGGNFSSSHKDKNLDEIAQEYVDGVRQYNPEPTWDLMQTAVCYGANWRKEQFEKNRLANCDALSKEECDRETDFAMEIIEKEHRQPTFNDAINYGMRLQKEQKPSWSEKDEKNLELVTDCVYEFYPDPVMKYKLKDWLTQRFKFIHPQPHWKPSEKQMCSLRNTIVNTKGYQYSMYLPELYEQLKKLM